jgi:hypothetical protein
MRRLVRFAVPRRAKRRGGIDASNLQKFWPTAK